MNPPPGTNGPRWYANEARTLLDTAPPRWFADPATAITLAGKALLADLAGTDPAAYAACCDALATYDLRAALPRIRTRTLVVAGRQDPATPPAHARELADAIPQAGLTEIAGAAHLAGIDAPAPVTTALLAHLDADRADRADRYDAGTTVRREVLGDAHVDRANARTTPLTAAFQDLITRYAWGEIWTRPDWTVAPAAASPSPPSSPTATTTNSPCTSGQPSPTASPPKRSARSSCSPPSTAASRPPTPLSRSPSASSTTRSADLPRSERTSAETPVKGRSTHAAASLKRSASSEETANDASDPWKKRTDLCICMYRLWCDLITIHNSDVA